MNREERKKIYFLLSQFYENAKQLKSPEKLTAWGLVLQNYTYGDVKAKVLEYAAQNKYFPDISDITAGLTPVASESGEDEPYEALEGLSATAMSELLTRAAQNDAAFGGHCQIRKLWKRDLDAGEGMMEGLFLRRHFPEDCAGCRRMQEGRCTKAVIVSKIERERERCLILKGHAGEAHQSEVLKKYWRELCRICPVEGCFWPKV